MRLIGVSAQTRLVVTQSSPNKPRQTYNYRFPQRKHRIQTTHALTNRIPGGSMGRCLRSCAWLRSTRLTTRAGRHRSARHCSRLPHRPRLAAQLRVGVGVGVGVASVECQRARQVRVRVVRPQRRAVPGPAQARPT